MKQFLFGALLFLAPSFIYAAGFAKQSIFLSSEAPTEGQTVVIYVSVSNPATTTFSGTLILKDEASEIGSSPVTLKPGGADTVSVSWKPTAGTHKVVATLKDSGGAVVEEGTQNFTIAKAPTVGGTPAQTISPRAFSDISPEVQPSESIQTSINDLSPTVGQYTSPIFKTLDSGRVAAANQIYNAIDWSKSRIATSSKSSTETRPALKTAENVLATVALYVLTILLYIITNAGVFYPALAILFLYTMWRLWRRYRR